MFAMFDADCASFSKILVCCVSDENSAKWIKWQLLIGWCDERADKYLKDNGPHGIGCGVRRDSSRAYKLTFHLGRIALNPL